MPKVPNQTSLKKSLVHGKIQTPITEPAILAPQIVNGVKVDPMRKGIQKLTGKQAYIQPEILEMALNDVFEMIGPKDSPPIVHSYEEAIVGVDGDPYKRSLNRMTSPGYPYNLNNKSKGKTAWLGNEDTYDLTNKELRNDVDKLLADCKEGRRGDAIFIATLKDEKRPIEKVDAGKTRVFEA